MTDKERELEEKGFKFCPQCGQMIGEQPIAVTGTHPYHCHTCDKPKR